MKSPSMKNLHVPLPEAMYRKLREESMRSLRPATELAREAIDRWLFEARRNAIRQEIASYAAEMAGSSADLDPALERAGIEHLLGERKKKNKK